jgi:hypothetical protein
VATYRIRVTEFEDIEAGSKAEALSKFHSQLTEYLNGGHKLDTDVTIVTDPEGDAIDEIATEEDKLIIEI